MPLEAGHMRVVVVEVWGKHFVQGQVERRMTSRWQRQMRKAER